MTCAALAGLWLAVTVSGCGDRGGAIVADNASHADVIVAYREWGMAREFVVAAESRVNVMLRLGGADGVVDVYTADCQPLAVTLSVNRLGYTLIRIDATRSVSTTTVDAKDVTWLPGATEVASATCP